MGIHRLSFLRILLSIFLRTFVFLLVVFVLAGFSWTEKSKNEASTVFLLDMSDSISQEGKKWMWDYVRDSEKNLDKKNKKGLVVFGGESKVITPTLAEDLKLDDIREKITESNTNSDRTDVAS